MKQIRVIFLGYAVDTLEVEQFSGISIAGNKMQVNILRELDKVKDIDLHIITIRPVASFPHDKKLYYKKKIEYLDGHIMMQAIPFWNLPVIKQFSQCKNVYKQLKKEMKRGDIQNTIILSFNMFPQVGIPTVEVMKKYRVNAVSLLADLPIDDKINRRGFNKWLREKFDAETKKSISMLKNVIVLNRNAVKQFAPDADYIVIDGGIDSSMLEKKEPDFNSVKKIKNIVYGGSLNQYSGILTLAKAMKYIPNKDIFLDIYGSGEGEDEIKKLADSDRRIRFWGRVDNETMLQKQQEAYLLANPRPVNDSISMVTFPSKIFEYMLSGTPIVSTRLSGFTEEYNDKMFFFYDETEEGLANAIINILKKNSEELVECAKRAYQFVCHERSWKKQVEKINQYLHKSV